MISVWKDVRNTAAMVTRGLLLTGSSDVWMKWSGWRFFCSSDFISEDAFVVVVMLNTFLRFNENVYINFHFSTHACLQHVIYSPGWTTFSNMRPATSPGWMMINLAYQNVIRLPLLLFASAVAVAASSVHAWTWLRTLGVWVYFIAPH